MDTPIPPDGKRLRPKEVVNDYRFTLLSELDLKKEAANTCSTKKKFCLSRFTVCPQSLLVLLSIIS